MHTPSRSEAHHSPPATLPTWALWAVAPVVVALGIVAGMALATFRPLPLQSAPADEQAAEAAAPPGAAAPANTAKAPPGNASAVNGQAPPNSTVTGPMSSPTASNSGPVPSPSDTPGRPEPAPRTIRDVRDALAELNERFSAYAYGQSRIDYIEYRVMRNAGLSVSLVGIVNGVNYDGWNEALRNDPKQLKAWLETAAARVLPATEKEQVFLAWAVAEVRKERPATFGDAEVKVLENGTYLVTRPLASTLDPAQASVSLRPLVSGMPGAPAPASPWNTYGPKIWGDSRDIYRPMGISGR